jgi:O-acetyl-ADP-ribose deacetylase (regulator of RNase III)
VPEAAAERSFGSGTLRLRQADITTLDVDAIINAANSSLAGGGGVDGAVHRAGGPDIMRELRERYTGCPTGQAVLTGAGRLPARAVIHAVGPRWRDGDHGEVDMLASAYRSAFRIASEQGFRTVAAPSISTGIYGFPIERAAPLAIAEARSALEADDSSIEEITFALFSPADLRTFRRALESL